MSAKSMRTSIANHAEVTTSGTIVNVGTAAPSYLVDHDCISDGITSYSLEQHLMSFSWDAHYRRLWPNWCEYKDKWSRMLKVVDRTFPQYSSHDHEHSEKIIEYIEMLLGPSRIGLLSPTDTWLILQCAYTHDLGMCVSEDEKFKLFEAACNNPERMQRLFEDKDFRDYLKLINNSEFYPYSHADSLEKKSSYFWKKRVEEFDIDDDYDSVFTTNVFGKDFSAALYYYNLTVANWYRRLHADRSHNIILEEARKNDKGDIFSGRFAGIIANIARCHTMDWQAILKLEYQEKGAYTDYIHPRFIAALLRMGDLLDLDTNRFSTFQISSIGQIVKESAFHMLKHFATSALNVTVDSISVISRFTKKDVQNFINEFINKKENIDNSNETQNTRDCGLLELDELMIHAIKTTRSWMDWIRMDSVEFRLAWKDLAPCDMAGNIAWPKMLLIELEGQKVSDEDLDMRYEISTKRAAHLIEGSGLYNTRLVFLREAVQNAIDATKRRLFRELMRHYTINNGTSDPLKSYPYFLTRYKDMICQHVVEVKFCLKMKEKLPKTLVVEVCDRGIGITRKCLEKMKHIGDVYDMELVEERNNIPQWLQPTGDFGIGMQSVFLVTDRFQVESRPSTQEEKYFMERNITFNSTRLGGDIINSESEYMSMSKKLSFEYPYGTKLTVEIDLEKQTDFVLEMLPKSREDYSIISGNEFRLNLENRLHKILTNYITETFIGETVPINVSFEGWPEEKKELIISPPLSGSDGAFSDYESFFFKDDNSMVFWYADNSKGGKDKQECVCLQLRPAQSNSISQIRMFYRGIAFRDRDRDRLQVGNADCLSDLVKLPGYDCFINIMSGQARRIIEINRDRVNDKYYSRLRKTLSNSIRSFYESFFSLLAMVVNENGQNHNSGTQQLLDGAKRMIETSGETAMHMFAHYLVFKPKKRNIKLQEWLKESFPSNINGLLIDRIGGKAFFGSYSFRYFQIANDDFYFTEDLEGINSNELEIIEPGAAQAGTEKTRTDIPDYCYVINFKFSQILGLNYRRVIAFGLKAESNGKILKMYRLTTDNPKVPDIDDYSYYLTVREIVKNAHARYLRSQQGIEKEYNNENSRPRYKCHQTARNRQDLCVAPTLKMC